MKDQSEKANLLSSKTNSEDHSYAEDTQNVPKNEESKPSLLEKPTEVLGSNSGKSDEADETQSKCPVDNPSNNHSTLNCDNTYLDNESKINSSEIINIDNLNLAPEDDGESSNNSSLKRSRKKGVPSLIFSHLANKDDEEDKMSHLSASPNLDRNDGDLVDDVSPSSSPHHSISMEDLNDSFKVTPSVANLQTIKEGEVLSLCEDQVESDLSSSIILKNRSKIFSFPSNDNDDGSFKEEYYFSSVAKDLDAFDPELEETVDLPAELPPPPDGGWGWVVCLASFTANMIVDGVVYSFSPYLPIFSEYFGEPQGKVAWVSSLLAGTYLSAGPVVSALCNRFGCRSVCMVGSLIASLAFLSTIWANSVGFLMVTQGIIGGFGFGLMYLPAVVAVGYYFEKRRALATGIAVCGSGVGTMVFPPIVKMLIENYTWKGTNIIIAGVILNGLWCGALMRPLTLPKMTKRELLKRLATEERELRNSASKGSFMSRKRSSINGDTGVQSHLSLATSAALPTIRETATNSKDDNLPSVDEKDSLVSPQMSRNSSQPAIYQPRKVTLPVVGSVPNFERRRSRTELVNYLKVIPATPRASVTNLRERSDSGVSDGIMMQQAKQSTVSDGSGLRNRKDPRKNNTMLRPMSRGDIFYSGSIQNLQEFKSQVSIHSYRESTVNFQCTGASRAVLETLEQHADEIDGDKEKPDDKCSCIPDSIRGTLGQMLDFSLLKDPVFLLLGFANVFGMLGFYTPYVYLPSAAIEKGIDPEAATFLISIIGITNTAGRVLSGLVADLESVNALYVNNVCVLMSGICVFMTPFAYSYGSFVAIAIFFGFFVSPFIALTSIIVVDLMGLAKLTSAFGLLCIFRGVAGIISSPIAAAYISLTSILLVDMLGLSLLTNSFGLLILFRGSSSMIGPPLAGSIYDATQNYDVSFYVAGSLLFVSALLHSLVPLVGRHCAAHRPPVYYRTNQQIDDGITDDCRSAAGAEEVGEGAGITIDIGPKNKEIRSHSAPGPPRSNEPVSV